MLGELAEVFFEFLDVHDEVFLVLSGGFLFRRTLLTRIQTRHKGEPKWFAGGLAKEAADDHTVEWSVEGLVQFFSRISLLSQVLHQPLEFVGFAPRVDEVPVAGFHLRQVLTLKIKGVGVRVLRHIFPDNANSHVTSFVVFRSLVRAQ